MNIKDIIEKNEREFEEMYCAFEFADPDTDTINKHQMAKLTTHLHQFQLKLLEGVAENIGEKYASKVKKLFNGYGGKLGFTQNELLDLPLSSPPKTNNKEI